METVKKNKFQIFYITTQMVKITKPYREEPVLIYNNHKVIIFHLLNCISPLIRKLNGKMKQN